MDEEVRLLTELVKKCGSSKPQKDMIGDAIFRFHRDGNTENFRDTQLVTYGYVDTFGNSTYRLIEDGQRFSKLLECVERYRSKPPQFRRCYKGLLGGYFNYDPELADRPASGIKNWETLRTYLHDRNGDLQVPGTLPDWVPHIMEHLNLLTNKPCDRYGISFLEGNKADFTQAQAALEIPDGSWIVSRLVIAQIDAATKLSNPLFKGHIPKLLDLAESHDVLLNTCLARILHRYQQGLNLGLSPEIRDFAVNHWGNPWLAKNSAQWGLVPAATRAMIANWLKLELIHKFFNLLAEDGNSDTDRRRLAFWQRYHKQIDNMYFALGQDAVTNRSHDFLLLRKEMEGLLMSLGGPPTNNAFIMCIGDYVVVEFGIRANACFIFQRESVPFKFEGHVAGDGSDLKHKSRMERLTHTDRKFQSWEQTFESILYKHLGVKPASSEELPAGVGVQSQRKVPVKKAASPYSREESKGFEAPSRPSSWTKSAPVQIEIPVFLHKNQGIEKTYSKNSLYRICGERKLKVGGLAGGNMWVFTDDRDKSLNSQLEAWGFQYRPGRGWWREEG